MFNFFKKKSEIASSKHEELPLPAQEPMGILLLNQSDNCFERAEKMMQSTGIIDRMGLANTMAKTVQNYMDLDKKYLDYQLSKKRKLSTKNKKNEPK